MINLAAMEIAEIISDTTGCSAVLANLAAEYIIDADANLEWPEEDDYVTEWDDDDGLTDVEADAMTLRDAGWGTEEDYGYFGDSEF